MKSKLSPSNCRPHPLLHVKCTAWMSCRLTRGSTPKAFAFQIMAAVRQKGRNLGYPLDQFFIWQAVKCVDRQLWDEGLTGFSGNPFAASQVKLWDTRETAQELQTRICQFAAAYKGGGQDISAKIKCTAEYKPIILQTTFSHLQDWVPWVCFGWKSPLQSAGWWSGQWGHCNERDPVLLNEACGGSPASESSRWCPGLQGANTARSETDCGYHSLDQMGNSHIRKNRQTNYWE